MLRAVPHARVAYFVWRRFGMCRLRGMGQQACRTQPGDRYISASHLDAQKTACCVAWRPEPLIARPSTVERC